MAGSCISTAFFASSANARCAIMVLPCSMCFACLIESARPACCNPSSLANSTMAWLLLLTPMGPDDRVTCTGDELDLAPDHFHYLGNGAEAREVLCECLDCCLAADHRYKHPCSRLRVMHKIIPSLVSVSTRIWRSRSGLRYRGRWFCCWLL